MTKRDKPSGEEEGRGGEPKEAKPEASDGEEEEVGDVGDANADGEHADKRARTQREEGDGRARRGRPLRGTDDEDQSEGRAFMRPFQRSSALSTEEESSDNDDDDDDDDDVLASTHELQASAALGTLISQAMRHIFMAHPMNLGMGSEGESSDEEEGDSGFDSVSWPTVFVSTNQDSSLCFERRTGSLLLARLDRCRMRLKYSIWRLAYQAKRRTNEVRTSSFLSF